MGRNKLRFTVAASQQAGIPAPYCAPSGPLCVMLKKFSLYKPCHCTHIRRWIRKENTAFEILSVILKMSTLKYFCYLVIIS